jgi:alpha-amylase
MQLLVGLLSMALNATIVAFAALLLLVASGGLDSDDPVPEDDDVPAPAVVVAASDMPRDVVVELFEWRWDDIAVECETFLGPRGFAAVQVSPPNEHRVVAGYPWWQRYEPVSFALTSRGGDENAFADMVRRCAAAGVEVYVDAVINNMTGPALADDPLWGTGSAGSHYDYYDYPGLLQQDFHSPRCAVAGRYDNRAAVQRCNLLGRADLNTEADPVQNRVGAYLNRLLDLGVSGFRIDAANYMASGDIAGILARVEGLPFVYQAVDDGPGQAVRALEYLGNGAVTEQDYGRRLATAFRSGNIAELRNMRPGLGADDLVPSDQALVFVDSHETRRAQTAAGRGADAMLTPGDGAVYDLANVFMLAWPYGTARIMSGYDFSDPNAGPPSADDGTTLRVHGPNGLGCTTAWRCEHRRAAIVGMVGFRNHTDGAKVANWWSDDAGGRIAFARGERGFVAINATDEPMRQWLRTGLPAGRYCNAVAARLEDGRCRPAEPAKAGDAAATAAPAGASGGASAPGIEVTVGKDTSATFELPPRSAAAIYVGLQPTADPVPR